MLLYYIPFRVERGDLSVLNKEKQKQYKNKIIVFKCKNKIIINIKLIQFNCNCVILVNNLWEKSVS